MPVEVTIYESGLENAIATYNGASDSPFQFNVSSPSLWSPDSPTLYNMSVRFGSDQVRSYTGFRTISKSMVNGVVRPLLNGEIIFMFGTLDQGFWPDGIYTPPNREAMVYDLKVLKNLGFNMLRKHVSCIFPPVYLFIMLTLITNRLRSRMIYSTKHVTKWVCSSSKTCLHFVHCRVTPSQTVQVSHIFLIQPNKRNSLVNSNFL